MIKVFKHILCLIAHKWDVPVIEVGEIHTCQRCGYTEKLIDIDAGALGEQIKVTCKL